MSISRKSKAGIKSSFIYNLVINLFQFLVTAFAARSLLPDDFSLIGISIPIIAALYLLAEMGVGPALIQSTQKNITPFAQSLLFVSMFIGAFLSLLLYFFKSDIADFYGKYELNFIVPILCVIVPVKCYQVILSSLAIRELDFKVEVKSRFYGSLIGSLLSIVGVAAYQSPFFVIIGYLLSPIISVIYLRKHLPYVLIKLSFNYENYKVVSSFSTKIFSSNLIYFLTRSGLGLFAAKIFPPAIYASYYLANQMSTYPRGIFNSVVNNVALGFLSKIQGDEDLYRNNSMKLGGIVTFVTSPVAFLLMFFGRDIFLVIFGPEWNEAAELFLCFAFFIWFSMLGSIPVLTVQSKGEATVILRANLFRVPLVLFVLIATVYVDWGIRGFIVGLIASEFVPFIYLVFSYVNILKIKWFTFLIVYLRSSFVSIVSILLADKLVSTIGFENLNLFLLVVTLVFVLIYISLYRIFFFRDLYEKFYFFRSVIREK